MTKRSPTERSGSSALALLFAVGVLNLFDRQILNVLAQSIKADLHISDMQLGLLTGTAFGVFYSVLGIPLGQMADRVDRVRLIAAALVIWSAFTSLCGLTATFVQLFITRIGVGIGEAASQPASTALIPELFPEPRRTSAMSLMLAGAPVGSFLGLLCGGLIGSIWGWRTALLVAGVPGLCLAITLVAALRDPSAATRKVAPNGRMGGDESIRKAILELIRRPGYMWLVLANLCSAFLVYAAGVWLPPLFIRIHAMSTAEVGVFAALAVGIGGAIGTFGAGKLCDALRSQVRDIESKMLMTVLALSTPALLLTALNDHRNIALVSMFVFSVLAYAFLGPTVTLIQRAATPENRALAVAFVASTGNIVSLACGLPLVGWISDRLMPAYGQQAIRYALAYCAATGVLGAVAHWNARRALRATRTESALPEPGPALSQDVR
jgi:predicted MFS family arabinose efflux permease